MARIKNRLHTELTVDDRASPAYQSAAGHLGKYLGLMGGAMIGGYGLYRFGDFLKGQARDMFDTNVQFERFNVSLEVLYGSADVARKKMDWLVQFAKETTFELPQLVQGTINLKAFGLEAEDWMQKLGDLASATNVPIDQSIDALGKLASGLNGIAIRQFQYMGISRQMWMEQGIEFNKQGMALNETGEMLEALAGIIESKYPDLMEKLSGTTGIMLQNIGDIINITRMEAGETLFTRMSADIAALEKRLDDMAKSGELREWASLVGDAFADAYLGIKSVALALGEVVAAYRQLKDWGVLAPDFSKLPTDVGPGWLAGPSPVSPLGGRGFSWSGIGIGKMYTGARGALAGQAPAWTQFGPFGTADAWIRQNLGRTPGPALPAVGGWTPPGMLGGFGITAAQLQMAAHLRQQEEQAAAAAARQMQERAGLYYQRGWERQPGGYLGLGTYRTYDVPDLMGGGGVRTPGIPEPSGAGARKPVDISGAISELEVYSEAWTHFWGENHDYLERWGQMSSMYLVDNMSLAIGSAQNLGEVWASTLDMMGRMAQRLIATGIFSLLLSPFFGGFTGKGVSAAFKWISGFQHGTPYVPETGLYMLHRGEQVVPAHVNNSQQKNKAEFHFHGPIIGNRQWVRNELLPEIRNAVGKGWKAA